MRTQCNVIVTSLVLCATSMVAWGQIDADLFVDANAPGPTHDGSSWMFAFFTIQEAVNAASPDDHIAVAEGIYTNTGSAQADVVDMLERVHIHGGFKGNAVGSPHTDRNDPDGSYELTKIDGANDEEHVIRARSNSGNNFSTEAQTIIDGFKIKRGLATGSTTDPYGAGVYVEGANTFIRLEHVTVIDNTADGGTNGRGGGIYHEGTGNLEITKSVITENYAPRGAGFYSVGADTNNIANTVFSLNGRTTAPYSSSPTLDGGAMWLNQSELNAMNCVLVDNVALDRGAAIFWDPTNSSNTTLVITNCTMAFNGTAQTGAPVLGSGIHIVPGAFSNRMEIANSILWTEGPGFDIFWGDGGGGAQTDLVVTFSDVGDSWDELGGAMGTGAPIGFPGSVLVNTDPEFVDAAARDLRLDGSASSPCIDTGDINALPQDLLDIDEDTIAGGPSGEPLPWDLLRERRAIAYPNLGASGSVPDMGAYETPAP